MHVINISISFLVIAVANIVTAFLIVSRALLIVDSFEGGGIAYPALLVMDRGAVLLVASLVHVFALADVLGLALGLDLALV